MAEKDSKDPLVKPTIINEDDIVNSEPQYTDARYDAPIAHVIPSENVGSYEVKQWPMLGSYDDDTTNALGYPSDFFEQRRALEREKRLLEQKKAEEEQIKKEQAELEKANEETQPDKDQPKLTAAELDEIRSQAFSEGHEEGFAKGHEEGLKQGLEEGTKQGSEKGFAEGSEKGLEAGYAKGRAEGFEKGRAEGLASGEAVVLEQSERFRHLADALANPLREVDRDVTELMVKLIAKLASVVVKREINGDSEFIKTTVQSAISELADTKNGIEITLNPDDVALLEASVGREYMLKEHWTLKGSDEIHPGDAIVSSGSSFVNCKLDERLDALCAQFADNAADAVESAAREEIPGSPAWDAKKDDPLEVPQSLKDLMAQEALSQSSDDAQPSDPSGDHKGAATLQNARKDAAQAGTDAPISGAREP